MSISITWHGHATFSLDVNGTKLIVDPFLKGNNPMAQTAAADINVDYVLITHGHGDHVADALPIAQRCGATIISNFEICNWYNSAGHDKTFAQNLGGGYQHPFGYLKMTNAFHSSSMPDGSYAGMPGGFLLTAAGKHVYIAGDTGLFADMALIGREGLDLAVLPIGDTFTMGPADSLAAIQYLETAAVIPCHYNTFPVIEQDVHAWAESVRTETKAKPVVLSVDETYTLA